MVHGHRLTEVGDSTGARTLICSICGCWAQVKAQKLVRACRGTPAHKTANWVVLDRLKRWKHPGNAKLSLTDVAVFHGAFVSYRMSVKPHEIAHTRPAPLILNRDQVVTKLKQSVNGFLERVRDRNPDQSIPQEVPATPLDLDTTLAAQRRARAVGPAVGPCRWPPFEFDEIEMPFRELSVRYVTS